MRKMSNDMIGARGKTELDVRLEERGKYLADLRSFAQWVLDGANRSGHDEAWMEVLHRTSAWVGRMDALVAETKRKLEEQEEKG